MRGWFKRRLVRKAGQYKSSEDGASAVEFALVAAPFFYVLGCTCETGLMLFTEYVMQNSVQEAARLVRTGQVSTSDGTATMTAAEFKVKVCENVNIIVNCDSKVTVYLNSSTDFTSLSTTVADPLTIGKKPDGTAYPVVYTPGGKLKTATLIATYDWDFVFPFMDFLGNISDGNVRRLYGIALFRNEPF